MKRNIIAFTAVLLTAAFVMLRPVNVLHISNYHDCEELVHMKVEEGYVITTLIKHSVHKTPVYEYYEVQNYGKLVLTGTDLVDLGWGVPSTFTEDVVFEDNMMKISGMNETLEFLPFRISYVAEPKLILNNKTIDLMQYVDNYERIDVSIEKASLLNYLLRGEKNVFEEEAKRRQACGQAAGTE